MNKPAPEVVEFLIAMGFRQTDSGAGPDVPLFFYRKGDGALPWPEALHAVGAEVNSLRAMMIAVKEAGPKPFWRTSEFWLMGVSLIPLVDMALESAQGKGGVVGQVAGFLIPAMPMVYAFIRTRAKANGDSDRKRLVGDSQELVVPGPREEVNRGRRQ